MKVPASRRLRTLFLVGAVVLLALPGAASAGAEDRESAVVKALEAAETRMKAKMEEARLLETAGRLDEAIAALHSIEAIHEKSMDLVRLILQSTLQNPQQGVVLDPARLAPTKHSKPVVPLPPEIVLRKPRVDPLAPATSFLLRCQGEDGLFHASQGQMPDDVVLIGSRADSDLELTGWSMIALLDAARRLERRGSAEVYAAVRRAAQALAARESADEPATRSTLAEVVATWGLATAYSRLGDPMWSDPVRKGVERALALRDPRGLLSDPGSPPWGGSGTSGTILRTTAFLALLYETRDLTSTVPASLGVEGAIRATSEALVRLDASDTATAYALDMAREARAARGEDADLNPGPAPSPANGAPGAWIRPLDAKLDPLALMLGTLFVSARFDGDDVDTARWFDVVLVPAIDRQRAAGTPAAGSWDPGDAGSVTAGRAHTTALVLLAWLVPTMSQVPPVAR